MGTGILVGVFGVLIVSHAAYYTIQCSRSLRKSFQDPNQRNLVNLSIPCFDKFVVLIELIGGLILCMWASLTVPGKFLSILPHTDENRVVSLSANLDFMIFNHRGKAFPLDMDVKA